MTKNYKYFANGDSAVTVIFNHSISEQLSYKIITLASQIKDFYGHVIQETIPAYQSLTICYSPLSITFDELTEKLNELIELPFSATLLNSKTIEIPVCYHFPFSPDIESVSKQCQLSINEIITQHTAVEYLVHMLGFSPGFLYLGGLSRKLFCERKKQPEIKVAAGSVGIAGEQTGIYPQPTPGGWQIIGRTPLNLFNPQTNNPFIASPLDKIKFIAIDNNEFEKLNEHAL